MNAGINDMAETVESGERMQDIEISNPVLGRLAAKGVRTSDIIGLLTFCGVVGLGFVGWQTSEAIGAHKVETIQTNTALVGAIREQAAAQRLMTCIISQDQNVRKNQFEQENSLCQRMARLPARIE